MSKGLIVQCIVQSGLLVLVGIQTRSWALFVLLLFFAISLQMLAYTIHRVVSLNLQNFKESTRQRQRRAAKDE